MSSVNKEEELKRLYILLYKKDQEFEKAKLKRTLLTILGFSLFYFIVICQIGKPVGFNILLAIVSAIVLGGFHFFVNACIFVPLCQKGREESETLDRIRKRISELER
jgi:hypothetical protein